MAAGCVIGARPPCWSTGNSSNMGFCIACFLRGHPRRSGPAFGPMSKYVRPEIIGLVLGSFLLALFRKEFGAKGGSPPLTRFVLGMFVMIGCLMFLGCPFRMILRLAGGDWNALFGLAGFVCGILVGVFFLNRGYSLHRSYRLPRTEGILFPALMAALLVLLVGAPALLRFTESGGGPGAQHAAVALSLAAGLVVVLWPSIPVFAWWARIRDIILFRESKLLLGFVGVFASALVCNLILTAVTAGTYFNPGFTGQAVAHTDGVWNFLGMLLAGYGCVLLGGGCPLRQLVLSGEGNTDSAMTVLGLMAGAAFAHNFGLASSGEGPTANGKIAVIIGLAVVSAIACLEPFGKKRK
ncbi:MAG: YedE family putative selenium transporter [Dysosmobacter sp.]